MASIDKSKGGDSSDAKNSKSAVTPLANFRFPENNEDENSTEGDDELAPPGPLPLISLKQGLNKKATPWALSSWVKLALTLDGRDKITKVCQYTSRMLAWWYVGTNQMTRFKAVQGSLTTSRKAFRLGRSLIEVQKIRDSGLLELFFSGPTAKSDPAWKIIGNAIKMIGLMGFWAGDNVNFLAGSGLFDDSRPEVSQKERMAKRNQLKTQAAFFANRFYFFGAVAGLITGLKTYLSYRSGALRTTHERLVEATKRVAETDRTDEVKNKKLWKEAKEAMEKAREKQFSLFLALLKVSSKIAVVYFVSKPNGCYNSHLPGPICDVQSCVDVIVFSNNPGIDLHQKFRGKKNHEGFHCVCGLISASTVLYNSYPDAPKN
jgi:Peroxisomal biogenesis factor 11 (PEX11)